MSLEYLVTFKSTTAALRAKLLVKSSKLEPILCETADIIPVPIGLSGCCFGMGLKCTATEEGIRSLYKCLTEGKIDYKDFWRVGQEYVSCKDELASA